jgi:hypothetical protein
MKETGNNPSFGAIMGKVRWQYLLGHIKHYVLVTDKLNDYQLGFIKAALTNGVKVTIVDYTSKMRLTLLPVCDKAKSKLFNLNYNIEMYHELHQIDLSAHGIKCSTKEIVKVRQMMKVLTDARSLWMSSKWAHLEAKLSPITKFYFEQGLELRFDFQELEDVSDAVLQLSDVVDLTPEITEDMCNLINTWKGFYGIEVNTNEFQANKDTFISDFRTTWHTINHITITAEAMSRSKAKNGFKVRTSHTGTSTKAWILKCYTQILFYNTDPLAYGDLENWVLCNECQKPMRRSALECPHCESEVYSKLTAYDIEVLTDMSHEEAIEYLLDLQTDHGFRIDLALDQNIEIISYDQMDFMRYMKEQQ